MENIKAIPPRIQAHLTIVNAIDKVKLNTHRTTETAIKSEITITTSFVMIFDSKYPVPRSRSSLIMVCPIFFKYILVYVPILCSFKLL